MCWGGWQSFITAHYSVTAATHTGSYCSSLMKCSISVISLPFYDLLNVVHSLLRYALCASLTSGIAHHSFNYGKQGNRCRGSIRKSYPGFSFYGPFRLLLPWFFFSFHLTRCPLFISFSLQTGKLMNFHVYIFWVSFDHNVFRGFSIHPVQLQHPSSKVAHPHNRPEAEILG